MSGPCMTPGEIFDAKAASLAGGIIVVVIVLALFGMVIAICLGIAAIILLIASFFFLAKKKYGVAAVCFFIGIVCLPIAFGLYAGIDEWQKTSAFEKRTKEYLGDISIPGKKMFFRMENNQVVKARSKYDAAMGHSEVLSESEKDALIVKMIKKDVDDNGVWCRPDIANRTLDLYYHEYPDWLGGAEYYIDGFYRMFQRRLGLTEIDPVKVRVYCQGRLIATTGKMSVETSSYEDFGHRKTIRKTSYIQVIYNGEIHNTWLGCIDLKEEEH